MLIDADTVFCDSTVPANRCVCLREIWDDIAFTYGSIPIWPPEELGEEPGEE